MQPQKIINYYLPIWDFLYILQLEEYNLARYYRQVILRLFKRNFQVRDTLKYTSRIKLTITLFILIFLSLIITVSSLVELIVLALLVPLFTPFLILVASAIIALPTYIVKKAQLVRARRHFNKQYPNTKIIGVTGSFGKTTTKYLLAHMLQYDYTVSVIPDNINTGLGIANLILKNTVPKNTEYLIVEMGAHTRGDIKETAQLLPPDFAIITIFGDQHMERFGSYDNLIKAKSEIFTTNSHTKCYLSMEDLKKAQHAGIDIRQVSGVESKSFSAYVEALAKELGVSESSRKNSIETFTPPNRRNNTLVRNGVTILDNSYNLSPMVATYLLNNAEKKAIEQAKSLVVLTGGIAEQGRDTKKVNNTFAQELNARAGKVLLTKTVYSKHILQTLTTPHEMIDSVLEITEQPEKWLDGEKEILLWLTEHSDLAYL